PPKPVPADLPTDTEAAAKLPPPPWLDFLLRNRRLLFVAVLALALLIGVFTGLWLLAILLAAVAVAGFLYLNREAARLAAEVAQAPNNALPKPDVLVGAIRAAPPAPAFRLVETDPVVPPQAA